MNDVGPQFIIKNVYHPMKGTRNCVAGIDDSFRCVKPLFLPYFEQSGQRRQGQFSSHPYQGDLYYKETHS